MDYKVNLEKFTGPLDLLLSLIEEKKLAINDISLSQVTDQFLEYLKNLEAGVEMTIEYRRLLADFLVIASRLILIKSYSLLPNLVLSNEEEEDIKNFEERLKAYREIKIMAKILGKRIKDCKPYFSKEFYFNLPVVFYPPQSVSSGDFENIYKLFLKTLPQIEKLEEQSLARIMSLEEKIDELMGRISAAAEASFNEISGSTAKKEKINIILAFLAILMLFKKRILEISQDGLFGEITVKRINSL